MALDNTFLGASADSYVESIEEADTIVATLVAIPMFALESIVWDDAGEDGKETVLRMAADRIDALALKGERQTDQQARAWPRIATGYAKLEPVDSYPLPIKQAQVAEALALLSSPSQIQQYRAAGIEAFSIGEQSVAFKREASAGSDGEISPVALNILRGASALAGRVQFVRIPRG